MPNLKQRMRKWLLNEGVLTHPHGRRGNHRVAMIGRADGHRVDTLAHLVEHRAEVKILFGFRPADGCEIQALFVDVANRDHVTKFAGLLRVARSLAADTHTSKLDLFVGCPALAGGNAAEGPIPGPDDRRSLEKPAARCATCHEDAP